MREGAGGNHVGTEQVRGHYLCVLYLVCYRTVDESRLWTLKNKLRQCCFEVMVAFMVQLARYYSDRRYTCAMDQHQSALSSSHKCTKCQDVRAKTSCNIWNMMALLLTVHYVTAREQSEQAIISC